MIENFETEKIHEFEINSKVVQISPILFWKCTQTSLCFDNDIATQTEDDHTEIVDTGTQYNIENQDDQSLTEEGFLETESDTTYEDFDKSFHLSGQSKGELFENKNDAGDYYNSMVKVPSVIVVYWSSLPLPYRYFSKAASRVQQMLLLRS